ncbi:MAG: RNA polymerase sigma factor [Candidatus Acidiferrum sp.]|jgi:RNA polymerase sigma-70 factor (ECF subfamily)
MAARKPPPKPQAPASDERALVLAAQRDPAKFAVLYDRHFERVYAFIVWRVRDRAAAEELTAEVFYKALVGLPKYEWRGAPLAAWLFRIAGNAIADQKTRAGRKSEIHDAISDHPSLADPAETTLNDLQRIELHARVYRLVDELPEIQGRVIRQRFLEQRSVREIALGLGKTPGAIKQLQFRALRNLRAQIGGGHGE